MIDNYKESYYKTANYVSYLDRSEKYEKTARELEHLLSSLKINKTPYLDYGCAVGHLVKGFNSIGVNNIEGYDISEWAVNEAKQRGLNVSNEIDTKKYYGVVFFLDVLEHMTFGELNELFFSLSMNSFIFRIPVVKEEGQDYVLECSRQDPTHIIRWTKPQWDSLFYSFGYKPLSLDLNTIYDTEGVYCGLGVKL